MIGGPFCIAPRRPTFFHFSGTVSRCTIRVCAIGRVFPRRYLMRRGIVLGMLLVLGAAGTAGFQNPPAAPAALDIQKVKDNLYMIVTPNYGAGNTAVFI